MVYASLLMAVLTGLFSCKKQVYKSGDLLFVDNTSSDLTKAINEVTKKEGSHNYTHVGICKVEGNKVYVYHAAPEKNVIKESLASFLDDREQSKIDLYRVERIANKQLASAFKISDSLLGMPYDFAYIKGNDKMYCSELIFEMFKKDTLFKMNPMTFKNPSTGKFHKNWIAHYQKLGVAIPEGELGCNPNDMSKNERLSYVRTLGQD